MLIKGVKMEKGVEDGGAYRGGNLYRMEASHVDFCLSGGSSDGRVTGLMG